MTGVRYRAETGFEGRCDECREWWPLVDKTCWDPRQGLRTCRACVVERGAARNARRRSDPTLRASDVESMRAYRHANPDVMRAQRHAYYVANRARITERARARYAERGDVAKRLVYKRDWMRAYRASILEEGAA